MTEIGKMIRDEGLKEGLKEGLMEGRKEGETIGKIEGKYELLIKLLVRKFKKVPNEYREKIKTLSPDTLDMIAIEIFEIDDIKDLEKYF